MIERTAWVNVIGYSRATSKETLEFDDDCTEEEMNEELREWAENQIEYGFMD